MKIKNLRRPARAETSGVDVPPPQKVRKLETATVEASASDVANNSRRATAHTNGPLQV